MYAPQGAQPTGTNRPRAWVLRSSCSLWSSPRCGPGVPLDEAGDERRRVGRGGGQERRLVEAQRLDDSHPVRVIDERAAAVPHRRRGGVPAHADPSHRGDGEGVLAHPPARLGPGPAGERRPWRDGRVLFGPGLAVAAGLGARHERLAQIAASGRPPAGRSRTAPTGVPCSWLGCRRPGSAAPPPASPPTAAPRRRVRPRRRARSRPIPRARPPPGHLCVPPRASCSCVREKPQEWRGPRSRRWTYRVVRSGVSVPGSPRGAADPAVATGPAPPVP